MAEWWEGAWDNVTVTYTTLDGTGSTDTFSGNLSSWFAQDWVVDPVPNYLASSTWGFPPAAPKVIDDWWDIWGEILYD